MLNTAQAESLNRLIEKAREVRPALAERLASLPERPHGTVRAWLGQRHGRQVDTVQLNGNGDPWVPMDRVVDAQRRASACFFHEPSDQNVGSWRYYAGLRVLAADADTLVASDRETVIIYTTVPE